MFVVARSKDTSFSHLSLGHGMKMLSLSIPSFFCVPYRRFMLQQITAVISPSGKTGFILSRLIFFHDCAEVPWFRCL